MVNSILPLTLNQAAVSRRGKRLIGPIDLTISPLGFTIVMGPNGSGKTTLLRLMHGLERPRAGKVDWNAAPAQTRARQAYVFQSPIMMRRSVVDCIAFPMTTHGMAKKPARALAADWAKRLGLGEMLDVPAHELSGGEKQKLALARALIRQPDILFLDEPCANLDGRATREIEAILNQTHRDGTRIVMSTHDMGQARRLAQDVLFMHRGLLHETGPAALFFETPQTPEARAFLNGDIVE